MQFVKLILKGYVPLSLRNINYFEYTITSIWQLIIGTNGSGKSSVMRQLSPLPAEKNDFNVPGGKEVYFRHHGKNYKAISDFTRGNHHELWDLDEEVNLNPGRTQTVQKQLVKKLFGLTPELMDVLLGQELFTQMPALLRRDWLLELSQMDLDFGMKVFNKLKTKGRDMQGAARHLSKRLADEIEKLPKEVELEGLNEHVERLTIGLNEMLALRLPKAPNPEEAKKLLNEANASVKKLSQTILRSTMPPPYSKGLADVAALNKLSHETDRELERTSTALRFLYAQHAQYSDILNAMEAANVTGLEDFQAKITEQEIERDKVWAKCRQFKLTEKVDELSVLSQGVVPMIEDILAEIPVNYEQRFNKMNATELREAVMAVRQEVSKYTSFVDDISHKLNHRNDAALAECPECNHSWQFGFSEAEVSRYQTMLDNNLAALKTCEAKEKELSELEKDQSHYMACLRRMNQVFKQNPSMQMLWDAISTHWQSGQYPMRLRQLLNEWEIDLRLSLDVFERNKVIADQQQAFQDATGRESGNAAVFQEKMAKLQQDINETLTKKIQLTEILDDAENYRAALQRFLNDSHALNAAIQEMDKCLNNHLTAISQEQLRQLIAENQKTLANASQLLQRAAQSRAVIADISKSKEQAHRDAEVFAVLAQELSPVDGLIAEQLKHFIGQFTEQINKAIAYVWTYPLKVLPCGHDDSELDYKFPLHCHDGGRLVPDIVKGSSSQVDIVNFAFRLVVMLYKDMTDFPLYLDELAPSLDEKHRLNIIEFVKHLIDTRRCSQMFMIGHYVASTSVFTRAETCVMDDTNILTLPGIYNQHVVMR